MTSDYEIRKGDAVDFLRTFDDGSVDLLITDPAYESLEKHRKRGTTTRLSNNKASSNDWFEIFPNERFDELFEQVYRVLADDAHFYCFSDHETMFVAKPVGEETGFTFWKPLVWDKVKIGMGYHYRARYELILFFEKGKRSLSNLSVPDVLEYPAIRGGYPTEKPTDLIDVLIDQSSSKGELVVDPFMGSGSTGVSAVTKGRRFVGNDLSDEAVELTRDRLNGATGYDESPWSFDYSDGT